MGESKKHRKDDVNLDPSREKSVNPELDAVIPDIEDYQRKIEDDWQAAKESYESKINKIMDDFLKEKIDTPESIKPEPRKQKHDPDHLSRLLARVEHELQNEKKTTALGFLKGIKPPIINVPVGPRQIFSVRNITIGLVLFVLGAVGWFYSPLHVSPVTNLPYAHTTGPLFSDGKVYIADWFRKAIYVHALKNGLPIVAVENVPNNFITGLALSDSGLWTLDGFDNKVLLHTHTADHRILDKAATPGIKPIGLVWDGYDIWTADNINKAIYRHRSNDIEDIRDKYKFPKEMSMASFNIIDNRVWALDDNSREVHVFRLQKPLRNLASFDLDPFLEGATPTGISVQKKNVWVVTINPAKIIRISRDDLKKANPTDF